jgi:hypothetical protein
VIKVQRATSPKADYYPLHCWLDLTTHAHLIRPVTYTSEDGLLSPSLLTWFQYACAYYLASDLHPRRRTFVPFTAAPDLPMRRAQQQSQNLYKNYIQCYSHLVVFMGRKPVLSTDGLIARPILHYNTLIKLNWIELNSVYTVTGSQHWHVHCWLGEGPLPVNPFGPKSIPFLVGIFLNQNPPQTKNWNWLSNIETHRYLYL